MTISFQLRLLIQEELLELKKGLLIVTAHLPQQKLLPRLPVLQVPQPLPCVLLQDLELVNQLLVFAVGLR